jgi:hypothetical protein
LKLFAMQNRAARITEVFPRGDITVLVVIPQCFTFFGLTFFAEVTAARF